MAAVGARQTSREGRRVCRRCAGGRAAPLRKHPTRKHENHLGKHVAGGGEKRSKERRLRQGTAAKMSEMARKLKVVLTITTKLTSLLRLPGRRDE